MSKIGMQLDSSVTFMDLAIQKIANKSDKSAVKVLDFGCGEGGLVEGLSNLGYQAFGCDIEESWKDPSLVSDACRKITWNPYTIPFESDSIDVVVSTSVLEHAQNTREAFTEIKRVLKPGGYSIHLYPGKWYLPSEPHIFVPLVNFFWPNVPKWWLSLWAFLGIRNSFQQNLNWKEVSELNINYCKTGLIYLSSSNYRKLSMEVFGNYEFEDEFLAMHSYGQLGKILRKLPSKKFAGFLSREFRMGLLSKQKLDN